MTPATEPTSTLARIGSGLLCVLGLAALGFFLGGFLGGRVFGGGGMGWDQIADTLGGVAVGLVAGLGASVWAIRGLSPSRQVALGVGGLLLAAGVFAVIRALAP